MEYSVSWWLSYWFSILTTYALSGWINADLRGLVEDEPQFPEDGNGLQVRDGYHCREEDGKPYNSGDPRAG